MTTPSGSGQGSPETLQPLGVSGVALAEPDAPDPRPVSQSQNPTRGSAKSRSFSCLSPHCPGERSLAVCLFHPPTLGAWSREEMAQSCPTQLTAPVAEQSPCSVQEWSPTASLKETMCVLGVVLGTPPAKLQSQAGQTLSVVLNHPQLTSTTVRPGVREGPSWPSTAQTPVNRSTCTTAHLRGAEY
ncbi:hypothetical protein J1605_020803 [Eschrichtius robustus]|uniref:Uncharacterized protein n=1 Tax=Eschrichtius robustus TaxID=9764 RepID=A0AB34HFU2_ESCRO|nr:hypothetical protein J1605_020803 [Eschrichtius robustus]